MCQHLPHTRVLGCILASVCAHRCVLYTCTGHRGGDMPTNLMPIGKAHPARASTSQSIPPPLHNRMTKIIARAANVLACACKRAGQGRVPGILASRTNRTTFSGMGSTHVGACAVCLAPGVVGVVEGGTCAATCAIALIGPVPLVGRPMVRVIGVIVLRPPSPRAASRTQVVEPEILLNLAPSQGITTSDFDA